MAYLFMPSSLQKRLLRYALSRVDLLDTDDLNLEQLDIGWGKQSTIELRHVGLKKAKLASLLHLPERIHITQAAIGSVKITVPADIHTSSIVVTIEGIRIELQVVPTTTSSRHPSTLHKTTVPRHRKSSPRRSRIRARFADAYDDEEAGLPSVADLAKSFLAEEPLEEKQELEAALASQPADLKQSVASLAGTESESEEGLGTGVGLPAFLAAFFRGVSDRLKVRIQGVSIKLDITSLHIEEDLKTSLDDLHNLPTALGFEIGLVDMKDAGQSAEVEQGTSKERIQGRKVVFEDIQCSLLKEDPQTGFSQVLQKVSSPGYDSSKHEDVLSNAGGLTRSDHSENEDHLTPLAGLSPTTTRSGFDDGSHTPTGSTPSYTIRDAVRACRDDKYVSISGSMYHSKTSLASSGTSTPTRSRSIAGSHALLPEPVQMSPLTPSLFAGANGDSTPSVRSGSSLPLSRPDDVQGDLSQSMLFDKDEAESLYMSAMGSDSPVQSFQAPMPGAWGYESEAPTSSPRSPHPREGMGDKDHTSSSFGNDVVRDDPSTLEPWRDLRRLIFHSNKIDLWLPATVQSHETISSTTEQSRLSSGGRHAQTMRNSQTSSGSFSSYAARSHRESQVPDPQRHVDKALEAQAGSGSPHLSVSSANIEADVLSLSYLITISRRLQALVGVHEDVAKHEVKRHNDFPQFKSVIKMLHVHLLSTLPDETFYSTISRSPVEERQSLLELRVEGVSAVSESSKLEVAIKKVAINALNKPLIAFDDQVRMRTSVRDLKEHSEQDIRATIMQIQGNLDVSVTTKPLKLDLDIETLSARLDTFGRLSALLELISSTEPSKPHTSVVSSPEPPRTVRFQGQPAPVGADRSADLMRLNVRFGGSSITVYGLHHTLRCSTTAVKLAHRQDWFGAQVDELRLIGPFQHGNEDTASKMTIRSLGLKYLARPQEPDLARLISLLTPSNDRFEEDDDLLVDTLLNQRNKGAVLRVTISGMELQVSSRESASQALTGFAVDMARLSSLTKYLPEDNRPGLMTLLKIDEVLANVETGHALGTLAIKLSVFELAHVGLPALLACSVQQAQLEREDQVQLIGSLLPDSTSRGIPMFMARFIGGEPEPAIKLKLWNVVFEYNVPLAMKLLGLSDDSSTDTLVADLTSSIASLSTSRHKTVDANHTSTHVSTKHTSQPPRLQITLRECGLGLKPRLLPSKAILLLSHAVVDCAAAPANNFSCQLDIKKGGMVIVNDVKHLVPLPMTTALASTSDDYLLKLAKMGFVSVTSISAAVIDIRVQRSKDQEDADVLDIGFRDELFVLETCADSTQTLIELLNDLAPPMPPPKGIRYQTEIAPVDDMLASFSGDAFAVKAGALASSTDSEEEPDLDFEDLGATRSSPTTANALPSVPNGLSGRKIRFGSAPHRLEERQRSSKLANSAVRRRATSAKKWDSVNNKYIAVSQSELASSPLRVKVRDIHFIWNMFDGYDWQSTRDTISRAVYDIEQKAEQKRRRSRHDEDEEDEPVVGDFLFNSIYIGVPVNADPQELTRQINRNMDDMVSETASMTSAATSRPSSAHRVQRPRQKLKLERSKRHKLAIELRGLSADVFVFAPGNETQTSIDVRVADLEIFDHVPTSTWKKFATYMHDAGVRDEGQPMIHLEICNVRPIPELLASELVIKATVLPVRLHIDQDALDFMTRFFDFKDDSTVKDTTAEEPYLQRVEVVAVPVKMDYKPKKVDFAGLRSGRTTEFMNFFILESADFVLKHTIVYGTSGFTKLRQSLEDVWMPDIRRNQLPSVLSGLNGVRTVVNVGTGVRDLVMIPIQEYKRDGRLVRSISKGALAFAKTTGGELTKFGARLAIGAQNALQGAEDFLSGSPSSSSWDGEDLDDEEKRAISHYANQPAGILQGLKGAARSLERDILITKDVIIAISGEMRESGTAEGAARAVVRHAPTLILRPMIGASKAISQTLMGATNTVDPQNRRRVEDKYKKY